MTRHFDSTGAARIPLPAPEPESLDGPQQYSELLTHYNVLYHTIKTALVDTDQLTKTDTPDTNVLADMAAAIIREWALSRPKASESAVIADKAEREEWQRRDTRWRALDMARVGGLHGSAGHRNVDQWIDSARRLAKAVESDDFTG